MQRGWAWICTSQVSSRGKHFLIQTRVGRAGEGEQSPAWRRGSTVEGGPLQGTCRACRAPISRNPNARATLLSARALSLPPSLLPYSVLQPECERESS